MSSSHNPDDVERYNEYKAEHYQYHNGQLEYSYQSPPAAVASCSYAYVETFDSSGIDLHNALPVNSTEPCDYAGCSCNTPGGRYEPAYAPDPSSGNTTWSYNQSLPQQHTGYNQTADWEAYSTAPGDDIPYSEKQGQGSSAQSSYATEPSTDKPAPRTSTVRTPRQRGGPPPELTSVFDANPRSSQRKLRRTYDEEEKKKVERVRSIGACIPCGRNKRACETTRPCKRCVDRASGDQERARIECKPPPPESHASSGSDGSNAALSARGIN
ncbi:hypothetical protein BJ878DRAFT_282306 [Calycina marina]|uniref:Zn(2)-C6 fungal-type domain-containing protein n=1 Tax=Calycina marina TaxID=1763456 RepID=A0A9P7YVK1_9HELO|nr:hypothetical protein BJ878DRAFT_282306 [Calycina marina]